MSAPLHIADELDLPLDAVTQKFGFFAQSGAGKTYAATKFAELLLAVGAQVIVLDPVGVWWGLRVAADGTTPGFAIPVLGGEHGDIPLDPHAGALVADLLVDECVSAVLDISEFELPDHKRFVRDFAERFFQRKKTRRSPVHLFLEEAQVIAPLTPDKDETVMLNRVERLCRIGRNYGVGWSIISQRPQDVHTKVRNQVGTLFALRTLGTHERKAIAEWVSDKARSKDELSIVDRLPELDTGVAQVWSPNFLKLAATIRITTKTTFDSSATPAFGAEVAEPKTLADVDLGKLRERMAAAIEQAAAHNPHALQRRIQELEQELARVRSAPTIDPQTVAQARAAAYQKAMQELARYKAQLRGFVVQLEGHFKDGQLVIDSLRREILDSPDAVSSAPTVAPRSTTTVPGEALLPSAAVSSAAIHGSSDKKLSGAERKILTVLAQYPAGRTKTQIALLTGYAVTGGGFNNALGSLRTKTYITGAQHVEITAEGLAALGESWEQLPTGRALIDYWLVRLGKAERAIVQVLVDAGGEPLSKQEVAARARYEASGGGFNNALGRLRTLELVDGRTELRLHKTLVS